MFRDLIRCLFKRHNIKPFFKQNSSGKIHIVKNRIVFRFLGVFLLLW